MKLHQTIHEYLYRVYRHFTFSRLSPQTKIAYIKICYRISSFICISGSIFWNFNKLFTNVNIGYAVILSFHLRGQTNSSKHIEMSCQEIISWLKLCILYLPKFKPCGIKFVKLIIVWNISNLFYYLSPVRIRAGTFQLTGFGIKPNPDPNCKIMENQKFAHSKFASLFQQFSRISGRILGKLNRISGWIPDIKKAGYPVQPY